jgi:GTP-binding protein
MPLLVEGRALTLIDTAGLRRSSKVSDSLEYYTALRSRRAAERADVALVVCDALDGVTAQDLRVAELAMRSGCATAIVLNKWDLQEGDREQELEAVRRRVAEKLRMRPRVLTASARTGRNVPRLLSEAIALGDRMAARIPTPELNRFVAEVVQERQPPRGTRRGRGEQRLKLLYLAQIGTRPPRLALQVNSRARVTRDYAYFLENRLRSRFAMDGVPLIIDFVERRGRGEGRPRRRKAQAQPAPGSHKTQPKKRSAAAAAERVT